MVLISRENKRKVYSYLLNEGVIVLKKDFAYSRMSLKMGDSPLFKLDWKSCEIVVRYSVSALKPIIKTKSKALTG